VVNWFWRRRDAIVAPRLRPRADASSFTKVDLAELTPDREQFLGRAARVQLVHFEGLSKAVAIATALPSKERLSRAAAIALRKHHLLVAEIERTGATPATVMEKHAKGIEYFQSATIGSDLAETIMSSYISAGLLDDFFSRLAAGLKGETGTRVANLYAAESYEKLLVEELAAAISAQPHLEARMAMWGRRLVGDSMLVARGSLAMPPSSASDEARIEPVFTELIAAHTRRMDALGLTA
jgi:hypothetical protein